MKRIIEDKLPRHVAVIMDGNGRWAKKRHLSRIRGHRRGVEAVRDIMKFSREIGINYLTLYAFSKENWNRPDMEVRALMKFLEVHLKREAKSMVDNNIKFRVIGNTMELPKSVRKVIADVERMTDKNSGMVLQLALSYSGRWELVEAARAIAVDVAEGKISIEDINEKSYAEHLHTAFIPDPDLLIRSSGEMRISNFLLWQLAYTEIYVTDVLWPDFTREDMIEALLDYQKRERRFGLTGEQMVVGDLN
ncbi:MAG: isoprenyl transferase [Thermodesulfobacteriota bacterium]